MRRLALALPLLLAPLAARAAGTEAAFLHAAGETRVAITFAAPAPVRLIPLDAPPRLAVDLPGPAPRVTTRPVGLIAAARGGLAGEGAGRLLLDLARPAEVVRAELVRLPDGRGQLRLRLAPAEAPAIPRDWPADARPPAPPPPPPAPRDPRPVLAIDPGHGGADPGAMRDGLVEKDLTLAFARALADAAEAEGRWRPVLTREDDRTLGLRERTALAEAAGAAALISLHANTVERGSALGASVYTLSDRPTDAVTAALAAYENRADVLSAGDLLAADGDDVAAALTELSRRAALVASRALGDALAEALSEVTPMLRDRAHEQAGFVVLTSPLAPSALVELGFLGAPEDAARLTDPAWRARAARALLRGLDAWAASDAARAGRHGPAATTAYLAPTGPGR